MPGGGAGGGEVLAAHYSETINDNEMKSGWVVENHKLINLVKFDCHMTSSLRHNDVITLKIWSFCKNLANQSREV